MKKRVFSIFLVFVMVLGMLPGTTLAAETVTIDSEDALFGFAQRVNSGEAALDAVLTEDITVTKAWSPIGLKGEPYAGTFHGGGHMITLSGGITFTTTSERYGLFDTVTGTIQDLTVAGTVDLGTQAGNVGGIAGYLEASGTVKNCINIAAVSGKNNIGGIVGMSKGTVTQCGNRGAVKTTTNTGSYVAGIVGMSSSGSSIAFCYNQGEVTSKNAGAGGIAGYMMGKSIVACYNQGNVAAETATAGGAGGIAGQANSSTANTTIVNTYNVAFVSGGKYAGAIVGMGHANTSCTDAYYLEGVGVGNGLGSLTPGNSVIADALKAAVLALTDSEGKAVFMEDTENLNDGWPVLAWQTSGGSSGDQILTGGLTIAGLVYVGGTLRARYTGAENVSYQWYRGQEAIAGADSDTYTVDALDIGSILKVTVSAEGYADKSETTTDTVPNYVGIAVTPDTATLTVTDSAETVWTGEGGIYALPAGTYTYTAAADGEYEDVRGNFTVPYTEHDGVLSIALAVKTYDVTFNVTPSNAAFTLEKDGVQIEPVAAGTTSYKLAKGDYAYSVFAFGYEDVTDETFHYNGEADKTVALTALPLRTVTIVVDKTAGGPATEPTIVVRDADGTARDYTKGLPAGTYTYAISCGGYQSARGSFTVEDGAVSIRETLALQTVWDGVTVTEPARDSQGGYLIGSPAELAWFGQNASMDANAKLIADIVLNEDMSAGESSLYQWTPIGASSSQAFTGTFDGGDHTVSGVSVQNSVNGTGFFGYLGTGGEIRNLTVNGRIQGTKNYTGGIVGDCKGSVINCHNLAQINGYRYVGGIVGDLEKDGTMENCSNRGAITASDHTVGGVVGRIDAVSSSALRNCYNTDSVKGASKVGGIVGDQYGYGSAVTNVYNVGEVRATTGYAGGIVGNFRCSTIENAYMACEVVGATDAARGKIAGALESASQTKTLANVFYRDTPAFDVVANEKGCTVQGEAVGKNADELKVFAAALGDAFIDDANNLNGGYPILKWQVGQSSGPEAPDPDPEGWDGVAMQEPTAVNSVYQIGSAQELAWFASQLKTYPTLNGALTADIDLNNQPWTPMCGAAEADAYTGSFDGQGHTIQNLCVSSRKPGTALFAGNAGSIQNLTIEGQVNGADYAAALAAYNYGSIDHCRVKADVTGGNDVAGLVAVNMGAVSACSGQGCVTASKYVGGIVALNKDSGVVTRSFHTGMAESASDFAGGVCAANEGEVSDCYNTGLVIGHAAALRSYVGGVIGWNNNTASNLYNTGAVVSMGSHVGGVVGITTTQTTVENLYGTGAVMGMYYEDNDSYEQYYVGAVVGRKSDCVSNAYYLNTLAVTGGGIGKSEAEMKAQGFPVQLGNSFARDTSNLNGGYPVLLWQTRANTPDALPALTGSLEISGELKSGGTLSASYTGNAEDPLFVWYTADEDGEYVLDIGAAVYKVPVDLAGKLIRVKAFSASHSGAVAGEAADRIEGMNGSVYLSGPAVVGKTLTAAYSRVEDGPQFQWYRGNTAIPGATGSTYTVAVADVGYVIKVRVTGNQAGYVEKAVSSKVVLAEDAGVWADSACTEPANVAGVYVITDEQELHWFVSEVNGGNTSIQGRLSNDLTLTTENWYPIGHEKAPFLGTFDGNGKKISGFRLTSDKGEQGFFGVVGGNGEVKNLSVSGTIICSGENAISAGGIVGSVEGKISGCTFSGTVSGHSQVGGIAGQIGLHGMVQECCNTAIIRGVEQLGGIAGASSYGDIYYCANRGTVGGVRAKLVGGIVGEAQNYAVITGCYNVGDITGTSNVGGISGKVYVASAPLGCYSAGSVTGGLYTGGVLGSLGGTDYIPTVHGSFYLNTLPQDRTASAQSESAMKNASFVTALNRDAYVQCYVADAGINDGYPILKWEREGHGGSGGGGQPDLPTKERIDVTFTLLGDTIHGNDDHEGGTVTWISMTRRTGLPGTTTAYDLFRQVLDENGYTYEARGNSYIAYITSPAGVRLGEFSNGAYSGWMYTINGVFPDYMASVTLQDGDDMVFFFTDDYRDTGWNPNGRPGESTSNGSYGYTTGRNQTAADKVSDLIDAIGDVTEDSKGRIEAARAAYDALSEVQKKLVINYDVLIAAEEALARLGVVVDLPFTDAAGHWALESIRYVYDKGLMAGTGETIFAPDITLDRGMLVTILYRLEGEPAVTGGAAYADVAQDAYYAGAVAWATENKIVSGYGNGFFGPADNITREQMASMLYRYASYKGYDVSKMGDLKFYTDTSAIGSWAVDAIRWANAEGLISGRTSSTIVPGGTATRAEAATILTRFCQRYVPELTAPEEREWVVNTNGSIGIDSRSNTLRPRAVLDGTGRASVRISGTQLKKLTEMSESLGVERAMIIPSGAGSLKQITLELPKLELNQMAYQSEVGLEFRSPHGELILNTDALRILSNRVRGEGAVLTLCAGDAADARTALGGVLPESVTEAQLGQAHVLRVSAASGSNDITALGEQRVTLRLPVEEGFDTADAACTVLCVAGDGMVTKLAGKYVRDGEFSYISVSLSDFGTVIVLTSCTDTEV